MYTQAGRYNEKKKQNEHRNKHNSRYKYLMKENTEYLELFIIVDDTKPQQGQENLILSFLDLADINSYKY